LPAEARERRIALDLVTHDLAVAVQATRKVHAADAREREDHGALDVLFTRDGLGSGVVSAVQAVPC
jgi:hypothetical protein